MNIIRRRKLVKKDNTFYVNLPVRLLRHLGWRAGDYLFMWNDEENSLRIRREGGSIPRDAVSNSEDPKEKTYIVSP